MSATFHRLNVKKTIAETKDATSYYFTIPEELKNDYAFKSGQYLTLKLIINGEELRRSYSLCSSPYEGEHAVTIKRVKKGKVSNYLNDNVANLEVIDVMTPDGKFILEPNEDLSRDHYFLAGGSGITPMMSMIKTVLEEEPKSRATLLYGNQDLESIIFLKEFNDMEEKYAGQFKAYHTLDNPPKKKKGGLAGMFSKGVVDWDGMIGFIDRQKLNTVLEERPSKKENALFYICGPGNMIDNLSDIIVSLGYAKEQIKREYFTAGDATKKEGTTSSLGGSVKLTATIQGNTINTDLTPGKTILEALIEEGQDPPYSCTSGACSTCVAKIKSGTVEMEVCHALDDDEVANGYILTCQAHPTSEELVISYDE